MRSEVWLTILLWVVKCWSVLWSASCATWGACGEYCVVPMHTDRSRLQASHICSIGVGIMKAVSARAIGWFSMFHVYLLLFFPPLLLQGLLCRPLVRYGEGTVMVGLYHVVWLVTHPLLAGILLLYSAVDGYFSLTPTCKPLPLVSVANLVMGRLLGGWSMWLLTRG